MKITNESLPRDVYEEGTFDNCNFADNCIFHSNVVLSECKLGDNNYLHQGPYRIIESSFNDNNSIKNSFITNSTFNNMNIFTNCSFTFSTFGDDNEFNNCVFMECEFKGTSEFNNCTTVENDNIHE